MKHYTLKAIENLINNYVRRGGEVALEVIEGSLGYGTTICYGEGLKTAVIQEVFENCWSSTHTIRMYNKLPKKYEDILINHLNKQ
jgi:hypothetical protein